MVSYVQYRMPEILALGGQRQKDLCEFSTSVVYPVSSRLVRATWKDSECLKKERKVSTDSVFSPLENLSENPLIHV